MATKQTKFALAAISMAIATAFSTAQAAVTEQTAKKSDEQAPTPTVKGESAPITQFVAAAPAGKVIRGTADNSGGFMSGADLTIEATGKVINNKTVNIEGELFTGGVVNATGTVVNKGTMQDDGTGTWQINNLDVQKGGKANIGTLTTTTLKNAGTMNVKSHTANGNITNAGTLNIDSLTAKTGITYTQTGDTSSLNVTNGWFTNSTLNIEGGTLVRDDFGKNVLNISGTNQLSSEQNKTKVQAGTLTSNTTVNLKKGGTLSVGTINLTSAAKTLNIQGGRLETSLDQLFTDVKKEVHKLEAANPQDMANLTGNYVPVSSIGELKAPIHSGMTVTGGTIAFTDSSFGMAIAGDVLNKINSAYSSQLTGDQLEIAFTGKGSGDFTLDIANHIISDNPVTHASFLSSELKNTVGGIAKQNLVVGTVGALGASYGVLNDSMGFKYIDGAEKVAVNNGKTLVLVGDEKTAINLVQSTAGTSDVTVSGKGKLMLGSYGKAAKTQGTVKTIRVNDGTLNVRNGDFTVTTLLNGAKPATVDIEKGAKLTLADSSILDTGSKVNIAGQLAGSATLTGTTNVTGQVNTTNLKAGGAFTNAASGNLSTQSLMLTNGKLTNQGVATITGSGKINAGATLDNAKTLNITGTGDVAGVLNTAKTGTTTQAKSLAVANGGKITNAGIYNANGNLTVAKGGAVTNTASGAQSFILSFAKGVAHNVAGLFTNSGLLKSDASQQGTLTIAEGGKLQNNAGATATLYNANLEGGSIANAAGGTVTVNVFTGNKGTAASSAVVNDGTMNIQQFTLTDGKITGTGTLDLGAGNVSSMQTSQVGAQGSIQQGTLLVKNAKLNSAGAITVNKLETAKSINTSGTFKANTVALGDNFTVDAGTASLGTVTVDSRRTIANKGKLDITGAITGTQADLTNTGAGATLTLSGLTAKVASISNTDGTLTIGAATTVNDLRNNKTANITGKLVAQAVTNNTGGTMNMASGAIKKFNNHATAKASGAVEVSQIVQGAQANTTFNGDLKLTKSSVEGGWSSGGMSTNDGTITAMGNVIFDSSTLTNNKLFDAKKDFEIGGTVKNSATGTINALTATLDAGSGKLYNAGNATIGKLTMAATSGTDKSQLFAEGTAHTNVTTLSMDAKSEIANAGALKVGTLAKATDVKYTQTGNGSIAVTDGWFDNSVLRIEGGVIDDSKISTHSLGKNSYIVKGTAAPVFPETANGDLSWQDGQTKVIAQQLTSDTNMTLEQGGLLDVGNITLTAGKTLSLAGGTIVTSLSNFFDGVATSVVGLEAMNPSGRVEINTSVLASTGVKDFKTQVADNMNLNNGHIAFDNQFYSAALVSDVTQKMANAYRNVTVHFTGTMDKVFTLDIAKSLIDEQATESPVRNPGVIFDTTTLYAQSHTAGQKTTLDVGGADAAQGLTHSMGFQNVANATGANIHGGKELALVGWSDIGKQAQNVFAGATASSMINVTGAGSKFTLGSDGLANKTYGSVGTITLADTGDAVVKNGTFKIGKLDAQNGTLNVKTGGEADVANLTLTATGKVENSGHLILNQFTDVAESVLHNVGNLTAKVANTLKGKVSNEGVAKYEAGLTVMGAYTNGAAAAQKATLAASQAGTQTTDLTVQDGGSFVNNNLLIATGNVNVTGNNALRNEQNATIRIDGDLTINAGVAGTMAGSDVNGLRNDGTMKAGNITISSGELRNWKNGILQGTGLTIAAEGALTNAGTTLVDTMDANGTLRNVGKLVVGSGTVSSFLANSANITIKDKLTVAQGAVLENKKNDAPRTLALNEEPSHDGMFGTGELALSENATFNNMAMFRMARMSVASGATTTNASTMALENATISGNVINGDVIEGEYIDGQFEADTVTMDGGKLTNRGTYKANNLVFGTGTVEALGGTFETRAVEFGADGIFKVATDGTNGEAKAYLAMADNAKIDGQLIVEKGTLTLGQKGALAEDAFQNIQRNATLVVGANNIQVNGKVAVGSGAQDKTAQMNAGDMWFGNDSLLVLDTSKINETVGAFLGSSTGGTLTVEGGAQLHLAKASWGKHYLVKDMQSDVAADAWTGDNLSFAGLENGNVTIDKDENGLFITAGSNNIQDALPNVVMPNIVNAVMGSADRHNVTTGTIGAIASALELQDQALQTQVLNSMAGIGQAGQTLSLALRQSDRVQTATERHLGFADSGFEDGQLLSHDAPVIWADALYAQADTEGSHVAGNVKADASITSGGFIFGTDVVNAEQGLRYGASLAFQRAQSKTDNLSAKTKNDSDTYGINAYAAYTVDNFNFIGNVGYAHAKSDIEQGLDATNMGKATADVKANIFTAGLRAEAMFGTGDVQLIPHLGVRLTHIDQNGYRATVGGATAFNYDAEKNTLVEAPIGVTLRANSQQGDWKVKNTIDLSIIPTMGDKDTNTKIHAMGATDTFSTTFADDVKGEAHWSIEAKKGNFSLGAEYGLGASRTTKVEHSVGVKARFAF